MTAFSFRFKDISGQYKNFQISQSAPEDLWCIYEDNTLLARITRIQETWKQLSGDALPKELIRGAGAHIQQVYYNSVALQIKERWPGIIGSVEKKSNAEIAIICKPQVNLSTFRSIFCKHVTRLFTQEVNMELKVYNYNFSQDFSYKLEVKHNR